MNYKKIQVDSILNKITNEDKLFGGNYTIDPYRNCEFGCLYCDSSFDKTIYIKTNAVDVLKRELANIKKGKIIVGSVHDPYQRAEEEFKITRDLLKTIQQFAFSCHILTKSDLIMRDIDILNKIEDCSVTVSITSLKDTISKIFEKDVPLPETRIKTIDKLTNNGIKTGLAVIPVLPHIVEKEIESIIKLAIGNSAQYLLYKYLELKGDQKTYFINILKENYPNLVKIYENLYKDSYKPDDTYILKLNNKISRLCSNYGLKNKI